jgi:hypothetical protein
MSTAKRRMVFTSVNQILTLIKTTPALQEMPRFASLKENELSTTPTNSCNCSRNIITPDVNKQILESALNSLNDSDFLAIKNALLLDELCYYKRNNATNKLEMICI